MAHTNPIQISPGPAPLRAFTHARRLPFTQSPGSAPLHLPRPLGWTPTDYILREPLGSPFYSFTSDWTLVSISPPLWMTQSTSSGVPASRGRGWEGLGLRIVMETRSGRSLKQAVVSETEQRTEPEPRGACDSLRLPFGLIVADSR